MRVAPEFLVTNPGKTKIFWLIESRSDSECIDPFSAGEYGMFRHTLIVFGQSDDTCTPSKYFGCRFAKINKIIG